MSSTESSTVEYFDVVDEDDQSVGKLTTKEDAHAKGLVHRVVAVYVFAPDGRLYVQDHKVSQLLDHSVGGHVSAGEDYPAAAEREAEEELGLKNERLEPVYLGLYSDELFDSGAQTTVQKHEFGIFECNASKAWKFSPNEEVERVSLETVENIVKQMNRVPGKFTPGFINTMAKYLEVKGLPYKLDVTAARRNWSKTR